MKDIEKRIEEITSTRNLVDNRLIVDALLELDAQNVDLGKTYTFEAKKRMKDNSIQIIKAIKEFDKDTYKILAKGIDRL